MFKNMRREILKFHEPSTNMTSCLSNQSVIITGASAPFAEAFCACYSGKVGFSMEKKI